MRKQRWTDKRHSYGDWNVSFHHFLGRPASCLSIQLWMCTSHSIFSTYSCHYCDVFSSLRYFQFLLFLMILRFSFYLSQWLLT